MLGILRGSLVTACCGVVQDISANAKVKMRRAINEGGRSFSQLRDWAFLHTTVTFNIVDGDYDYAGSGYLPLGFQRFVAQKITDSNGDSHPIDEKSLAWYSTIEDVAYEGEPFAVVLKGLDSNGYQQANFYYCPDDTYTFEADCDLVWTDVSAAAAGDTSRVVVTDDCFDAFKYWCAMTYAVAQGDDEVIARCQRMLYGDRMQRIPGVLDILLSKQRGALKKRGARPDGSYKNPNLITSSDYGRRML